MRKAQIYIEKQEKQEKKTPSWGGCRLSTGGGSLPLLGGVYKYHWECLLQYCKCHVLLQFSMFLLL